MDIHKVGVRAALEPRGEPFWRSLGTNRSIGYRVTPKGSRSWLAKHDRDGKKQQHALGDDSESYSYKQAAVDALKWFNDLDQGLTSDPTVRQICADYVLNKSEKLNNPGAAYTARLIFERVVYKSPLANIRSSALRKHHFQDWVDALKATTSPANLKRQLTALQAALNLAVKKGKVGISARQHWSQLELPTIPDNRRELFLDLAARRALLAATTGGLRDLGEGAMLTGCRAGELTGARVKQFNARTEEMTFTGKTGSRTVPLSPAALALFKRLSKDKTPLAFLFVRDDGTPWPHSGWDTLIKAAAKKAKLPGGVCLYTLRHSFISEAISGGLTTLDVARLTGTSLQMIEKFYGKIVSDVARERLAKVIMV
jgi:integrase